MSSLRIPISFGALALTGLLVWLAFPTSGEKPSTESIRVQIVDIDSGRPISDATVIASYYISPTALWRTFSHLGTRPDHYRGLKTDASGFVSIDTGQLKRRRMIKGEKRNRQLNDWLPLFIKAEPYPRIKALHRGYHIGNLIDLSKEDSGPMTISLSPVKYPFPIRSLYAHFCEGLRKEACRELLTDWKNHLRVLSDLRKERYLRSEQSRPVEGTVRSHFDRAQQLAIHRETIEAEGSYFRALAAKFAEDGQTEADTLSRFLILDRIAFFQRSIVDAETARLFQIWANSYSQERRVIPANDKLFSALTSLANELDLRDDTVALPVVISEIKNVVQRASTPKLFWTLQSREYDLDKTFDTLRRFPQLDPLRDKLNRFENYQQTVQKQRREAYLGKPVVAKISRRFLDKKWSELMGDFSFSRMPVGQGWRVRKVAPQSFWAKLQVQAGDRVVSVDEQVLRSMVDFRTIVRQLKNREYFSVILVRNRQRQEHVYMVVP